VKHINWNIKKFEALGILWDFRRGGNLPALSRGLTGGRSEGRGKHEESGGTCRKKGGNSGGKSSAPWASAQVRGEQKKSK